MKNKYIIRVAVSLLILSCYTYAGAQSDSLNSYSFELYNEIRGEGNNILLSPLSTYCALLNAYEGARGDTKKEFEQTLHLKDNEACVNDSLLSKYLLPAVEDSLTRLNIFNSIWMQDGLNINEEFQQKATGKYSTELKRIDFSQPIIVVQEANNWVSDKTNGLIKEILTPASINEYTRMVISNAIYFKGEWENKFDKKHTAQGRFFSDGQNQYFTDFMGIEEKLPYYADNEFQFIAKPYKGGDISFCIILPNELFGIENIEKKLNSSLLNKIFNNMFSANIMVTMPKLKFEESYSLKEYLKKMGLKSSFSKWPDFSGITTDIPLSLDEVMHKTYIELDEEETKAAASTAITIVATGIPLPPIIFKADHPFVFMIIDNTTKAALFIGRYSFPPDATKITNAEDCKSALEGRKSEMSSMPYDDPGNILQFH